MQKNVQGELMNLRFEAKFGPWLAAFFLSVSVAGTVFAVGTFDPYCEQEGAAGSPEAIWLIDDFEDGNLNGWLDGGGTCNYFVVHDAGTAAEGEYCLDIFGDCGNHYLGPYISLAGFQAGSFTIWVRANYVNQYNGYIVLDDDQIATNGRVVFFYGNDQGMFLAADHNGWGYPCGTRNPNQWYQIRFVIDWDYHTFDVYIDNDLRQTDIPFPVSANTLNWLYLYNMGDGHVWYDYIIASTPPPTPVLFVDGFESGDWSAWSAVGP